MTLTWCALFVEAYICYLFGIYDHFNSENISILSGIIVSINIVVACADLLKQKEDKKFVITILGGFLFRIILLLWDLNFRSIFTFPDSLDMGTYVFTAANLYEGLDAGRGGLYSKLVCYVLYTFFGVQPIIAQYVNVLLAISTIIITKKILRELEVKTKYIFYVVLIMSFLPYYAMNNVLMLREIVNQFLIAVSLYFFVIWYKKGKMKDFVLACIATIGAAAFHSGAIAPLVAYAICYVLYDRQSNKFNFKPRTVFAICLCIAAFAVINASMGDVIFGKFGNVESVEDIAYMAEAHNDGGASYDVGIESGNASVDMVVNTPLRMFYFVLSPVPWKWRGINDILGFFCSAALYGYAYIIAIKSLLKKDCVNKNMIIVGLIIALSSAMIFAWGVSNAGAALRHRDKFICPYMVLLGLSLPNVFVKKESDC